MPSSRFRTVALAALVLATASTHGFSQTPPAQPYAGLEQRQIKALSADDLAELADGRGMGLALAAELNGYPGPRHVLDLSGPLGLTGQQRGAIGQLFDSMRAEAIPLGQKLIAAETDLDRAFADRTITPERLEAATAAIAAIRGALRNTHLKYHLATAALLRAEQITLYAELRGYAHNRPHTGHSGTAHGHAH